MAKPPAAPVPDPLPPPPHPPTLTRGDVEQDAARQADSAAKPATDVGEKFGRASARYTDPRKEAE